MTTPCYPKGCSAGSQVPGTAQSPPAANSPDDYAWMVNFNNGNSNWDNRDNSGFVRAVRPSECQAEPSFRNLHAAWREARRHKKPSQDQANFEAHWIDELLELEARLKSQTWAPSPPTCFVARQPKAREIHAPAFADRVVHHFLVPQLERIYERSFIHDSYSNREGKGTHAAVARLQQFVRQVHSGQGGGYYLQLDIRNFFNSIHRPTLYGMLKRRMERYQLPVEIRRATHALLQYSPAQHGVHYACSLEEHAIVPPHKRLDHAPPGCGIAIGNLSSQFFANVYLDALDQFVKHQLRVQRYLRYVDDFVLVHERREQLEIWQAMIERFLAERLRLQLKPGPHLRPLADGIDFLGYVIYPTHLLVRRRVVAHARGKLRAWARTGVRRGRVVAGRRQREQLRSIWMSYAGHFEHARSYRLREQLFTRFPWLEVALAPRPHPVDEIEDPLQHDADLRDYYDEVAA